MATEISGEKNRIASKRASVLECAGAPALWDRALKRLAIFSMEGAARQIKDTQKNFGPCAALYRLVQPRIHRGRDHPGIAHIGSDHRWSCHVHSGVIFHHD